MNTWTRGQAGVVMWTALLSLLLGTAVGRCTTSKPCSGFKVIDKCFIITEVSE